MREFSVWKSNPAGSLVKKESGTIPTDTAMCQRALLGHSGRSGMACFPCLRLSENTLVGNIVLPDFCIVLVSCSRISPLLKTIQKLNLGQVYDRDSCRQPVSRYLLNLSINTRRNVLSQPWYDDQESRPSLSDIRELVDFLRGDFEQIAKPSDVLLETEEQILRLTEEQYRCPDQLQDNPRCLFDGGAGTGKTLLALEFARREASSGRKVLLICFNKLLGQWLALQKENTLPHSIEVDSFHHFLDHLIAASSVSNEFRQNKTN